MEWQTLVQQLMIPTITAVGGLLVAHVRNISKNIDELNVTSKEFNLKFDNLLKEMSLKFAHHDEKVEDIKDRLKLVEKRRI